MNRDVCEHFVPSDLHCEKCKISSLSTLEQPVHFRREWRGLMDEEIEDCWDGYLSDYQLQMIRTIEAKLKEKNHA